MKKVFVLVISLLLQLCIITGCTVNGNNSFTGTGVAVEGPASQENPKPLNLTFSWNGTGHGTLKILMPDGEICEGKYSTVPEDKQLFTSGSIFTKNDYARFFGNSYLIENKQYGQAILFGNNGTVITGEYYVGHSNHGYGLGKDNKGNTYKFIF